MPTTIHSIEVQPIPQYLPSMFNRKMDALRPEFAKLNEAEFKKEIARKYKSDIVEWALLLIRLKMRTEARDGLRKLESNLKATKGPLDVDLDSFKRAKKGLLDLFKSPSIIKLRSNTSLHQLDSLFDEIYYSTAVSPEKRRQNQDSVKSRFYECIAMVEWGICLRFPMDHKNMFDWFLDENVLKYEKLLRHLRQSHSARVDKNEPDRARLNRETFKRSYLNNTKHLWAKIRRPASKKNSKHFST